MVSVNYWLLCFALSLLSVGPLPGCSVDALQGIGRPVELYGAQTPPRFLTVFTESGRTDCDVAVERAQPVVVAR